MINIYYRCEGYTQYVVPSFVRKLYILLCGRSVMLYYTDIINKNKINN